ncbi:hypothetical protein CAPTEDRAFT_209863 [Capitella teleta]|uniref:Major facilitator superfamily (MFS) profile domain-containing protein n=1 Tax=Capitella teleta TaxID=283909 RepID=R7UNU2_CAPTE|nr:hypothetical protein CAPTEDRAFT_209863 [Capitella teleta]|eukprot:ELU07895.1 hypothetical protein CAPTEDRAFT_209863 [Capitella teleta]
MAKDPRRKRAACSREDAYSVVLVLAVIVLTVLSCGISFSFGLFQMIFLEVFQKSSTLTSSISAVNFAVQGFIAPVSSFLAERIGIRWTTIIGALLSFCGLFATTFAPNIYVAFITLGIITGMGFGIIFSMGTVAIALHFDRFRPVAFAVSQSGIHIGSFVYPFLGEWLLEGYGWRGTMLITSALSLNMLAAAMLIRDIMPAHQDPAERAASRSEIWTNWKYWLGHVHCFFMFFGVISFMTHFSPYAEWLGYSARKSVALMAIHGLSGLASRWIVSLIMSLHIINIFWLLFLTTIIPAFSQILLTFEVHYGILCAIAVLHSLVNSAIGPVFMEVACQIIGMQNFAIGYGFLLASLAAGALVGPPLAGLAYDLTGTYQCAFYVSGGSLIVSSVCVIPLVFKRGSKASIDSKLVMDELDIDDLKV